VRLITRNCPELLIRVRPAWLDTQAITHFSCFFRSGTDRISAQPEARSREREKDLPEVS